MKKQLLMFVVLALSTGIAFAGNPVNSIRFAHQMNDWRYLDDTHIVVTKGVNQLYVLELRDNFRLLRYSEAIKLTSTNDTIRPGFDNVAYGHTFCRITRIKKISKKEVLSLKYSAQVLIKPRL
jgi:hypothetical protein